MKLLTNDLFTLITKNNPNDITNSDLYIGDLMSFIMSHAKSSEVLVTIMNNINVIAVASLLDMKAIIFCENIIPTDEMIQKAEEENIDIYITKLNSVQVVRNAS